MTNSFIRVPPDSTGKKLHTQEHTVGADTVQVQVLHSADPVDPSHIQRVDSRGAASVRFSEGSPLSDAFGNLKVSQVTTVGTYDFVGDPNDDLFSDGVVGAGLITHLSNASTMSLSVGTALGDFASRTTNKYHYYLPGTGNLVMLTVALSDTFLDGCERRWGLFDASNGAYFSLDDLGALKCVLRSTTSGALVKTHVARASWNGDICDGTGLSGFTLDVSKLNIYWVDYQWLGAGRVRYGVVDDYGNRIVCHTMLNANHNLYPYMRQGSLPIQVNIENKRLTGGAASIRLTCASVQTEGDPEYTFWRYKYEFPAVTVTTSNHYCLAIKSQATVLGHHNITNAYPEALNVYVGGTGTVKVDLYWDYMTLATPTWALDNGSTVLGDVAGTPTIAGTEYSPTSWYLDVGSHSLDLTKMFEKIDEGLIARADGAEPQCVMVVASLVSGAPTIRGCLAYAELR